MAWTHFHNAPHDRFVWLFLPCGKWQSDASGRPTAIEHEIVQAKWDDRQKVWATEEDRHVYPSLWSDSPLDVKPTMPELS